VLRIDVKEIPPEGLDLQESLKPAEVHLQDSDEFTLEEGGTLQCHVELRDEGTVSVSGRLAARLGLVCGRCLDPFVRPVDQKLELFLLPHQEGQEEEDEVELTERDMVIGYYRDRLIELGEMVREQLVLTVPMKRLCREDCKGLCPRCGINKNRENCECPVVDSDPRLASLGPLFGR
jgi:uncharacterized protein